MIEQWRPVVGFEGYYEVSDQGRVRSLERMCHRSGGHMRIVRSRILVPKYQGGHRGGLGRYTKVCMSIDTIKHQRQTHILVLEAFRGLRPAGHQTCHFNGISDDNRLVNLRWGTPAENRADTLRHGTLPRGSGKAQAKLNERAVLDIRAARKAGARITALARKYGVRHATIQQIFNGKTWTHV